MDTLGELNTERWVGAARRYARFRRCYWRFFLSGFAVVVVFALPLAAAGEHIPRPLQALLFTALGLGLLVCWVGAVMSILALRAFAARVAAEGSPSRGAAVGRPTAANTAA